MQLGCDGCTCNDVREITSQGERAAQLDGRSAHAADARRAADRHDQGDGAARSLRVAASRARRAPCGDTRQRAELRAARTRRSSPAARRRWQTSRPATSTAQQHPLAALTRETAWHETTAARPGDVHVLDQRRDVVSAVCDVRAVRAQRLRAQQLGALTLVCSVVRRGRHEHEARRSGSSAKQHDRQRRRAIARCLDAIGCCSSLWRAHSVLSCDPGVWHEATEQLSSAHYSQCSLSC